MTACCELTSWSSVCCNRSVLLMVVLRGQVPFRVGKERQWPALKEHSRWNPKGDPWPLLQGLEECLWDTAV